MKTFILAFCLFFISGLDASACEIEVSLTAKEKVKFSSEDKFTITEVEESTTLNFENGKKLYVMESAQEVLLKMAKCRKK